MAPAIYAQIDYAFATYMFPLEVLIAGIKDSDPRIYGIRNPGVLDCYNSIGFHAIGSGSMHALASLIETYGPDVSEAETVYSVFRAKKVAEVAPGVGVETDLGIVTHDEKMKFFTKNAELFKVFSEVYEDERKNRKNLIKQEKVATLKVGEERRLTSEATEKDAQIESGQS